MRKAWTPDEDRKMRDLYPRMTGADVAQVLGRSLSSVFQRARKLSLEKSPEFLASDRSGRIARGKQHPNMIASQFKPGLQPWNKGVNWIAGGRSAETRFVKGAKPHNTQPVGSYRINKEGNLQRKVSEDAGNNSKRWRTVAELVWVAANGPVPAKHIVVFKPGLRTCVLEEITVDKVECITRAENARRNHPRNHDPELGRLVQLKGAINRQVNRIAREAREQA